MELKCIGCSKVHDLDEGPDIGECLDCHGQLRQGTEPLPDYTQALKEILPGSYEARSGSN